MPHRNSHSRPVLVARTHAPRTHVRLYARAGYASCACVSLSLSFSLFLFQSDSLPPYFWLSFLSRSRIRVTRLVSRITALVSVKKCQAGVCRGDRAPRRASFHPLGDLFSSMSFPSFFKVSTLSTGRADWTVRPLSSAINGSASSTIMTGA